MYLIVCGKPSFSLPDDTGARNPISMSGHTVQLTRQIVESAFKRGVQTNLIYPRGVSSDEAPIIDPRDSLPDTAKAIPFGSEPLPKSIINTGNWEFCASLEYAISAKPKLESGHLVFVSPFPLIIAASSILQRLQSSRDWKTTVLIRGGDGIKWLTESYLENFFSEKASRYIRCTYKRAFKYSDARFAASKAHAKRIMDFGVHVDGIVPTPPVQGASTPKLQSKTKLLDAAKCHKGCKPDVRSKWLIFSGRFHRDKRPDLAIKAFRNAGLSGWSLVLAGAGDTSLLTLADADESIHSLTVLPRDLPHLYNGADALIHTSIETDSFFDARPSSVTSAAFHGLPVLGLRSGGLLESLSNENARHLLVSFFSEEQAVREISERLKLLTNSWFVDDIGKKNARLILDLRLHEQLEKVIFL